MGTFGAYRRNSRGAVAACLVTTMTASSASLTPTRASRTWPSACAWKVKVSCDGRSAWGFAHAGGLAPENAMTCRGCARVTSERTCCSCQVLVPGLGSLVCRWPVFGCVVCAPAEPEATITPSARSEEHTSELQSRSDLVCRLLLEKKIIDFGRATNKISPKYLHA